MCNRTLAAIAGPFLLAASSAAAAVSMTGFGGVPTNLTTDEKLTNDAGQSTSGTAPYLLSESPLSNGALTQWANLLNLQAQLNSSSNTTILPSYKGDNLATKDVLFEFTGETYPNPQADLSLEGNTVFAPDKFSGNFQNFYYRFQANDNYHNEARFVLSATAGGELQPLGAVPEPDTWLTMFIGFGLVGAVMRRCARRSSATRLLVIAKP